MGRLPSVHKTTMQIIARLLTAADLSVLSNVTEDVFDDPINEASAKAFLEDANQFLVVAMDEGKGNLVVGFASALRTLHPDKAVPELFINEVGVAPPYQRKGVATAIMETLFAEANKAGCDIGWLAVDDDNETALAFYKAIGGKPPERQIHIDFDLGKTSDKGA